MGVKNVDFSANALTPNPAQDFVLLQTDLQFDRLQLMSAEGRLIWIIHQPGQHEQISLAGLPSGTYTLRFVKGNAAWTTRIVKM